MIAANPRSGNMFVYILGAVFLLGILIVVTKGSFQEGTGIDAEKVGMQVNEVERYSAELERAVSYILRNGQSESDIRFSNSVDGAYGVLANDPWQVFASAGGGAEYRAPPAGAQVAAANWIFSDSNEIDGVGSTCAADSCVDLIALLPNVTKSFCIRANMNNNITNPAGDAPVDTDGFDASTIFSGNYTHTNTISVTDGHIFAKPKGCFRVGTTYYYYHVLLAR